MLQQEQDYFGMPLLGSSVEWCRSIFIAGLNVTKWVKEPNTINKPMDTHFELAVMQRPPGGPSHKPCGEQ